MKEGEQKANAKIQDKNEKNTYISNIGDSQAIEIIEQPYKRTNTKRNEDTTRKKKTQTKKLSKQIIFTLIFT